MILTKKLRGKTVSWVATDEKHLVIGCQDGTEVKIGWGADGPEFVGQNVSVILPPVAMAGKARDIGLSS